MCVLLCDYANTFTEYLFTSSFYPLITKPTRITAHTATLIDKIFTNNFDQTSSSVNAIIFSDISDHLPIAHMCNMKLSREEIPMLNKSYKRREINQTNIESFVNSIKNISWNNMLNDKNNPQDAFTDFSSSLLSVYNSSFPWRDKKIKGDIDKNRSPWMTKCILNSVAKKNRLYKKFLSKPSKTNENKYKKYKNKLNHLIKIEKKLL